MVERSHSLPLINSTQFLGPVRESSSYVSAHETKLTAVTFLIIIFFVIWDHGSHPICPTVCMRSSKIVTFSLETIVCHLTHRILKITNYGALWISVWNSTAAPNRCVGVSSLWHTSSWHPITDHFFYQVTSVCFEAIKTSQSRLFP